jgi:heme o synthase
MILQFSNNRILRTIYFIIFVLIFTVILSLRLLKESDFISIRLSTGLFLLVMPAFSVLIVLLTRLYYRTSRENLSKRPSGFFTRFGAISLGFVILYGLLITSGSLETITGAANYCDGWPVCFPSANIGWIALFHRAMTGFVVLLSAMILVQTWQRYRSAPVILVSYTAYITLFVAQALLGSRLADGSPEYLNVLHQATAVASWTALLVFITAVFLEGRDNDAEMEDLKAIRSRQIGLFFKDILALTKPIVVLLLLVTTYAGMVIAARSFPDFPLTFWTLLGGFLAAGGSGAINQFIDREDDTKMQRTQNRPLPSGRLTPGEGLAVGVAMTISSFFIMVAFVNLLAAILSLAGIVYYVFLYSLILKKTTVQNIVIGGGAGAIPPLVGWAAATGSLNIPSLFLFAVVFMWTPPHFWALALVRRKDYARAGVPMLPVVRGETQTRWQIFLYTIELVALTLLLPLFGLGGAIYATGAVLLGLWLVGAAFRVWKEGGNKLAWKMYRYSSMYLAFLFLVLMFDRLIS